MGIGPLLRREYFFAIRRGRLFRDRLQAAVLAGIVVVACLVVWDWKGWDRDSVGGAAAFWHVAFGVAVAAETCMAVGLVLLTARVIAAERDKKTLDALLATRLSSVQVVFGLVAAGLFRFANAMAATIPMVVLMVYLGGVDARFALLAGVGLTSTALGVAALAVVASVESRTASHATRAGIAMWYAWFMLPPTVLLLRALFLPRLPGWLVTPLLWALDSSPMGLAYSLLGVTPRPGGLIDGVMRMAALQVAVAGALIAWAVWRLRSASRALYDLEGRKGVLRALRAANRTLPRRRACGDDPVLWNEVYGYGVKSRAGRIAAGFGYLVSLACIAVGTWWFAAPAFVELRERGFGPSPEAYRMPDLNPLARVIVDHLIVHANATAERGQARLECNLALRQLSSLIGLAFVMSTMAFASEGVARERRRDTWLGLLATPLSGRDIVRGKVLGALWRGRWSVGTLLGLWVTGLVTGAIHPLGLLAAVVWLGVSGYLFGMLGVAAALYPERPEWLLNPRNWPLVVATGLGMTIVMMVVPLMLVSSALVSYEDVQAAVHAGAYPLLDRSSLKPWVGAREVVIAWLAVMTAMAVWAVAVARSLARDFDALVGRPCRTEERPEV